VRKQTQHIERKTHSLEIIYDVAASINVSRDLDDLLTRFLHTIKDVVNARAAVVRLVTEDKQMRLVSSIGLDDDLMAREQLIPSEACLCGSAYKDGKVLFQKDLTQCDKIVGRNFFEQNDIGMIVVPLQYRDKTLGVYNLFVDKNDFADPEDIEDLLTSLGRHLGMAIDKARSDDEANRLSIMEERTRLAHELHDSLAQTLASLRFQVRVLDETIRKGEEPSIWHELEQIENNLDEAYAELRELITHFRAPIDKRGLIPAVEHLVDRFRNQTDISIYLQKEWNVLHLPPSIEVQALRIIQEALNNIRKHSQAHAVRVILRSDIQGDCRIIIEDDGIGMNVPKRANNINSTSGDHIGLSIMDERAARIGGTVKIESDEGEGTRIILRFPHPGTIPATTSSTVQVQPPRKKILP
jgi:two-component system nitrate/nitrite sensor histidine kinase NarX